MSRRFTARAFLLSVLLCASCDEEPKFNSNILEGRWEIVHGLRNGQETGTLSGTYFRFGADGKMITNLPVGPEIPVQYELSKSTILQKGATPIEFAIRSLSDSSMTLGFQLRGMQFEITLQKKEAEDFWPSSDTLAPNMLDNVPVDSFDE